MTAEIALKKPNGQVVDPEHKLDLNQITKACKVLLKHIEQARKERETQSAKLNLLAQGDGSDDDENDNAEGLPVWLSVATKKHITDKKRLKPGKIPIPHPINSTSTSSICLITADPQRTYKDIIASPAFPEPLKSRIKRVIGLSKLKAKYKPFETRRQLFAEHDLFLADDRIISHLPSTLGKIFYKGGSRRPIPIRISLAPEKGPDGKTIKRIRSSEVKDESGEGHGRRASSPAAIAKEIETALSCALVHISPGANAAIRVAHAKMSPEAICENINAVVNSLVEKNIPQGWKNVRAIHIKGANTMAFPVWLAKELWVEDTDVLEEKKVMGGKKAAPGAPKKKSLLSQAEAEMLDDDELKERQELGKKRKADETSRPSTSKHAKKKRRAEEAALELALERKKRADTLKKEVLADVGGVAL